MNLADLLARLGEEILARRAGVTVGTLRRWIRQGPSRAGLEVLGVIARRHETSRKAAKTREERRRVVDEIPTPPRLEEEDQLDPEDVQPDAPPIRLKRIYGRTEGVKTYNTIRYRGTREYITIGRPVTPDLVNPIVELVLQRWRKSGFQFSFTNFLMFRYIPFNPAYVGEMVKLQGQWVLWHSNGEGWFRSTTRGTESSIAASVEAVFTGYTREGRHVTGALESAETRVIWLEAINVVNFDDKPYPRKGY